MVLIISESWSRLTNDWCDMAFIKSLGGKDSVTFAINITEYRGGASRLVDMIITFLTKCPDLS